MRKREKACGRKGKRGLEGHGGRETMKAEKHFALGFVRRSQLSVRFQARETVPHAIKNMYRSQEQLPKIK